MRCQLLRSAIVALWLTLQPWNLGSIPIIRMYVVDNMWCQEQCSYSVWLSFTVLSRQVRMGSSLTPKERLSVISSTNVELEQLPRHPRADSHTPLPNAVPTTCYFYTISIPSTTSTFSVLAIGKSQEVTTLHLLVHAHSAKFWARRIHENFEKAKKINWTLHIVCKQTSIFKA